MSSLQFPLLHSQASTCLCVSVKKKRKEKENDLTTVLRRLPNGSTISALPLLCPAVRTPPSPVGPVSRVHDLNDADLTEARVAPLPAKQTLAAASTAYYTAPRLQLTAGSTLTCIIPFINNTEVCHSRIKLT